MGIKELFLNKGWAGKTLSRQDTIERLNPILRRHHELNLSYNHAINRLEDPAVVRQLNTLQKTARVDIAKLSESVLSAGGVSYNGTDLDRENVDVGSDDAAMIPQLTELESQFEQLVTKELSMNHQIRTNAILTVVQGNSRARLEYLRGLAKKYRQTTAAR